MKKIGMAFTGWMVLGLLVGLSFVPADEAKPRKTALKGITENERRIKRMVKKLEEKIRRIARKTEKDHPHLAGRLMKALNLIRKNLMKEDIEKLIEFLEKAFLGEARRQGKGLEEDLKALLDFLQDHWPPHSSSR